VPYLINVTYSAAVYELMYVQRVCSYDLGEFGWHPNRQDRATQFGCALKSSDLCVHSVTATAVMPISWVATSFFRLNTPRFVQSGDYEIVLLSPLHCNV